MAANHVDVRRTLTKTPLSRQHESRLRGKAMRRPKPIDWGAFDRRQFPKPAIDLAVDSYIKIAIGEYGAVQLYAQLTSAMALAGLPFDLITTSASICSDEARHADYAMQMARALTGNDVPVRVERDVLEAPWRKDVSLEAIDSAVLHVAALSETISCALIGACLERATDATTKALLGNLVSDEVHHARFGWYYLSWRSPQWTRPERQRVADSMAANVVMIERRFWRGRDAHPSAAKAARALGVLESEGQRAAVRAVMESEIVPALDSFGLGASHAWRVRERGA
jgi:rubrerythrin